MQQFSLKCYTVSRYTVITWKTLIYHTLLYIVPCMILFPDKLLSFEDSLNFVLEAARKYINISTSIKDDNLTLARICLKLIKDKNSSIQSENHLILAMHVLHEFNVNVLPLNIRNCENKAVLLDKCLQKSRAYRWSHILILLYNHPHLVNDSYFFYFNILFFIDNNF